MNRVSAYETLFYPFLERFGVDAESAHHAVIGMLAMIEQNPHLLFAFKHLVNTPYPYTNERLQTTVGGVDFPNPLLLPAGYDKNAEAVDGLFALGFGGIEIGTVPKYPQPGNALPRLFRPQKGAILNRYGFNSDGADAVAANLSRYAYRAGTLGVSIGINKNVSVEDAPQAHKDALAAVLPYADFLTINVSSPNTEGLRALQTYTHLKKIVDACRDEMHARDRYTPIFTKLAPDLRLEEIDEVVRLVEEYDLAGVMLTNTTTDQHLKAGLGKRWEREAGGVSGKPLRERATQLIAHVHKSAPDVAIIGMGGVDDLDSFLEKIEAGAGAVAVLSALVFKGPSLPSTLLAHLDTWLEKQGVTHISEIVGERLYL